MQGMGHPAGDPHSRIPRRERRRGLATVCLVSPARTSTAAATWAVAPYVPLPNARKCGVLGVVALTGRSSGATTSAASRAAAVTPPVISGEDRALEVERIHQGDDVESDH